MFAIGRRKLILGASALALTGVAACDGASGQAGANPDDMALGQADAPVTLIEYASTTCPHCADFHRDVYPQLKANYIDTGRLRLIFREFPTPPPQIAVAGFQVARCNGATPEQYFARLGVLFDQQRAIFASGSMEGVRQSLVEIGQGAGLSEQQVMECIGDQAGADRIRRTVETGQSEFNITGTPTLILNGRKLEDPAALTYEGLSRLIDQAIGEG
ncbi:MAG: DsbA family protein [Hyphomonadaceae bacterium]